MTKRVRPGSTRSTSFVVGGSLPVCAINQRSHLSAASDVFSQHIFCALKCEFGAVDLLLGICNRVKVRVRDHGTTSLRWFELQASETSPGCLGSVTVGYRLSHALAGTDSHAERLCASGGPNSIGEHFRRCLNSLSRIVDLFETLDHSIVEQRQPGGMVNHAALVSVRVERFKQIGHGDGSSIMRCRGRAYLPEALSCAASFRFVAPSKVEWSLTTFVPRRNVAPASWGG